MANGAQQAIDNATRLSEIGFPEFTAKLITDTFNAITQSYIEQMAQYLNVVQAVSQTLLEYLDNTVDDISANEIGVFLVALGGLNDAALNFLLGDSTTVGSLSAAEVTAINTAVALPPAAGASSAPATTGALTSTRSQTIAQAIARRIAVNKYDLLQTMVRLNPTVLHPMVLQKRKKSYLMSKLLSNRSLKKQQPFLPLLKRNVFRKFLA